MYFFNWPQQISKIYFLLSLNIYFEIFIIWLQFTLLFLIIGSLFQLDFGLVLNLLYF